MEEKTNYIAPEIMVLEFRSQGVYCVSIPGYMDGGDIPYSE